MKLQCRWNQAKASTALVAAIAGLITAAAPDADADIITFTGNATISSSDAVLVGTDFVLGETVAFDLNIDTNAVNIFHLSPIAGLYVDAISGSVNVGSTYEGFGAPSDLTIRDDEFLIVIDDTTIPSGDTIRFSLSNEDLVSNITPSGNALSEIIFEFYSNTGTFSGAPITNVTELPNLMREPLSSYLMPTLLIKLTSLQALILILLTLCQRLHLWPYWGLVAWRS